MKTKELTKRQQRALALWNEGHSTAEIGKRLAIAENKAYRLIEFAQKFKEQEGKTDAGES